MSGGLQAAKARQGATQRRFIQHTHHTHRSFFCLARRAIGCIRVRPRSHSIGEPERETGDGLGRAETHLAGGEHALDRHAHRDDAEDGGPLAPEDRRAYLRGSGITVRECYNVVRSGARGAYMAVRVDVLDGTREGDGQNPDERGARATGGRACACGMEWGRTGCMGAVYLSSTTNWTAGAEIGYWLSKRNFRANFSPCMHIDGWSWNKARKG